MSAPRKIRKISMSPIISPLPLFELSKDTVSIYAYTGNFLFSRKQIRLNNIRINLLISNPIRMSFQTTTLSKMLEIQEHSSTLNNQ